MKTAAAIVLALWLAVPSATFAQDLGPGPQPTEELMHRFLHMALKDYDSVKDLSIGEARMIRPWIEKGLLKHWNIRSGQAIWEVPMTFNSKNAFGGYGGIRTHYFWVLDGKLLIVKDEPE